MRVKSNVRVLGVILAVCVMLGMLVTLSAARKRDAQEPHFKNGEHNENAHATDGELSVPEFVQKTIDEHDVVVFSKSYCPYCKRAKGILTEEGIEFFAVELDINPKGSDIQRALLEKTGQRTVPNVFIKGQHLGGSDAVADAQKSGRLAKLLGQ